jgi:hypothetical protein
MLTRLSALLCAAAGVAALPSAAAADEDRWAGLPDPAPAVALADESRPYLVGDALYWASHDLAGICTAVGGGFAKLAGSTVYVCALK